MDKWRMPRCPGCGKRATLVYLKRRVVIEEGYLFDGSWDRRYHDHWDDEPDEGYPGVRNLSIEEGGEDLAILCGNCHEEFPQAVAKVIRERI